MNSGGSGSGLHSTLRGALDTLDQQAPNDRAVRDLSDEGLKAALTGLLAQIQIIRDRILPELQELHPRAGIFLESTLAGVISILDPFAFGNALRGPLCAGYGRLRDSLQKVTINLRLLESGNDGTDPFEVYEQEFPESAQKTLELLQTVTGFQKVIAETFHLKKLEEVADFLSRGEGLLSPEGWQQVDGFFLYIAGALAEQFESIRDFEESMYLAELQELPARQSALEEVARLHARIQIFHAGAQHLPEATDDHRAAYSDLMSTSVRRVVEILEGFQIFLDEWAQNIARRKYLQFKEEL